MKNNTAWNALVMLLAQWTSRKHNESQVSLFLKLKKMSLLPSFLSAFHLTETQNFPPENLAPSEALPQ